MCCACLHLQVDTAEIHNVDFPHPAGTVHGDVRDGCCCSCGCFPPVPVSILDCFWNSRGMVGIVGLLSSSPLTGKASGQSFRLVFSQLAMYMCTAYGLPL